MELYIRQAKAHEAETLVNIYHDAYLENEKLGFPASASKVTMKEVESWMNDTIILVAENIHTNDIMGTARLQYKKEWSCYCTR